eukprot:Cvel_10019.t1-p1 / transcript=Cvel_10019.t1 / gene=Cvel_10019 / organism=Chromera_velia_CCMP2878 / gene_product=Fibrillin-1, putative / transcript_product=Fibrillin-1, putative / location=Cvel_scaffold594:59498-77940(+) / protein_length=2898 / sequence_SO=supercontig / SO=protein_coding / is_pseudo=false
MCRSVAPDPFLRFFADPCGDGHNCHANATCENAGSSFTCSCNEGFGGDGVSCSPLTQIPPSDIGTAITWTKDPSLTYGGIYTAYKDYAGLTCPGRFRAMTNTPFASDGGWYSYAADENPLSGTSDVSDSNVELVLRTPCSVTLYSFSVRARNSVSFLNQCPSKMVVSGSADGSAWTQLSSFEGEIVWTADEVKFWRVNETLGVFNYFKFVIQRVSQSSQTWMEFADISLYASNTADLCGNGSHNCHTNATCKNAGSSFTCSCNGGFSGDGVTCSLLTQIPPSDIGTASSWKKDPSVTYGGLYTAYQDYTGMTCPGRFRAMTNTPWWDDAGWYSYGSNEWPISGAFDQTGAAGVNDVKAYTQASTVTISGTDAGSDSNLELILKTPCSLVLSQFAVKARSDNIYAPSHSPSKMVVSGSTDMSSWTELASFEGEINWTADELRFWRANETLGAFNYFKFSIKRRASITDDLAALADITLFTSSTTDLCGDGAHNCDTNALCENQGSSFACECNTGFQGSGVSCTPLILIPPSDVGGGGLWTKDDNVTYSGITSVYTDYTGAVCTGRFRALTNKNWVNQASGSAFATDERPPSGAFDRLPEVSNGKQGWAPSGFIDKADSTGDDDAEIILEAPCSFRLESWAVQARSVCCSFTQSPAKMTVSGSNDTSSGPWTVLGSFEGHRRWEAGEKRGFDADPSLGAFTAFKFNFQRIAASSNGDGMIADIELYTAAWTGPDECSDGTHNCDGNASCSNTDDSFTCACNTGYAGNGTACTALTQLPPSDIGRGDTWTEDSSVTYSGQSTAYKDYAGAGGCTGRYRVRTNTQWFSSSPWIWPPQGAFDRTNDPSSGTLSMFVTDPTISGTGAASDANVELILELPCLLKLHEFGVWSRSSGTVTENPSKAEVLGSTDLTSWTLLGSFSGEKSWVNSETKTFSANSTAGPFNHIKFVGQRVNSGSDARLTIADIILTGQVSTGPDECTEGTHNCDGDATCTDTSTSFTCACNTGFTDAYVSTGPTILVPPSDIGSAPTWTKDGAVTYGGFHTFSKDYASGRCAGTYRARTDTNWYDNSGATGALASNEWPPSGAFDNTPGGPNTQTGWAMANGDTCGEVVDCNVELILETPCSLAVSTWWVQAETGTIPANTPSAMVLSGSSDDGLSWTELGSFTGETGFSSSEVKNFTANEALGAFTWFKFFVQRSGQPSGSEMISLMSGVGLYGEPATAVDECTGALHDCDGNAICNDTATSFTCTCNAGFSGSGVSCSRLPLIPPADIGAGGTWTKDPSVTYGGLYTMYKNYTGSLCPGIYRAMSNTAHWNDNGWHTFLSNEFPPSGAFDRQPSPGTQSGWNSAASTMAGTSSGSDATVELILKIPCSIVLSAYTVQTRIDSCCLYQTPSKVQVSGSTDGSTWTVLGSYSGETSWTEGENKTFAADTTLGPFNYFKFELLRISKSGDDLMHVGDLELYALNITDLCGDGAHNCHASATCENAGSSFTCSCNGGFSGDGVTCSLLTQIPPSDIGMATSWKKDPSVTYGAGGIYSSFIDYAGVTCPGRFRAMSNTEVHNDAGWYSYDADEWPISGAFDQTGTADLNSQVGYHVEGSLSVAGTAAGSDSNIEVVIRTPCGLTLSQYSVRGRELASSAANQSPSKMAVSGSADGNSWTQLSSFEGEILWAGDTVKFWNADETLGAFSYFKFATQRRAGSTSAGMSFADITLYASNVTDLCGDGAHNCHADAACENAGSSFTCTCNYGFTGDGLSCSALTLVPPADIGAGGTWTKDDSNLFNSLPTLYTDYNGTVCPGRFRAKSSNDWSGRTAGTSVDASETPPSGLFDREVALFEAGTLSTGFRTPTNIANSGTDSGTDASVELIIETPCPVHLFSFGMQTRNDSGTSLENMPSKVTMSGSVDGSSWTEVGSFEGEINWEYGMTKGFSANSTLGPFTQFKFDCQKAASDTDKKFLIGDIELYGNVLTTLPPSDIGQGDTWTKDAATTYNSLYTIYKDYTGTTCPGRYRAMSSAEWYLYETGTGSFDANEIPPSGAFDRVPGSGGGTFFGSKHAIAGTTAGADASLELVLQLPCFFTLHHYAVQSRDTNAVNNPSKAEVHGSVDGSSWTLLGSFDGETSWTTSPAETKTFSADSAAGKFTYFKFLVQRVSGTSDSALNVGDLILWGFPDANECSDGTHNCDTSASCADTPGSFECSCNAGFQDHVGIGSAPVELFPPSDIGRGDTWTKNASYTYNGVVGVHTDYAGALCPGRYVAQASQTWWNYGASMPFGSFEWPVSGAFDRVSGVEGDKSGYFTATGVTNSGTSAGTDAALEILLQLPCSITLALYGMQTRSDGGDMGRMASKGAVFGSSDGGTAWTELGTFSGQTGWSSGETRNFTVDTSSGQFDLFKFQIHKIGKTADDHFITGDLLLYGVPHINECSTVIVRDDFTSFDSARWSRDEGQPTEGNSTISSGMLLFRVSGNLGPSGAPRISMTAPTGEYRARARVRYAGPSANFWTHLTVYDTPGQSFEFLFGLHNWNGDDYVGLQHPALSVVARETPKTWAPLSGDFVQLEMHSHGDGVFAFYTWTDPTNDATKVTIHSGLTNPGGTRSRLALCLEGYGADVSAEYDWLEVEVPTDDDECSLNTHDCNQNATSNDNIGSFECTCNDGWTGDGLSCSDVDECSVPSHNCDQDATCSNTIGSFICACNPGMTDVFPNITQVPPTDIGKADTWTKDTSVTFNSIYTIYTDYSGSICTGRYRAKCNTHWYKGDLSSSSFTTGEWPASGAFDGLPGGALQGFGISNVPNIGTASGTDSTVELALDTPCELSLHEYTVLARPDSTGDWTPSKMTVYGSSDGGSSWTQVASFSGETSWSISEMKTFSADSTLGPFNSFKFHIQKIAASTSPNTLSIGEIELFGHI